MLCSLISPHLKLAVGQKNVLNSIPTLPHSMAPDIYNCVRPYLTVTFPYSHSIMSLFHTTVDELSGGVDISMSIEFRTTQCTGLLLYIASSTHPDHLVLEIVDGLVSHHH